MGQYPANDRIKAWNDGMDKLENAALEKTANKKKINLWKEVGRFLVLEIILERIDTNKAMVVEENMQHFAKRASGSGGGGASCARSSSSSGQKSEPELDEEDLGRNKALEGVVKRINNSIKDKPLLNDWFQKLEPDEQKQVAILLSNAIATVVSESSPDSEIVVGKEQVCAMLNCCMTLDKDSNDKSHHAWRQDANRIAIVNAMVGACLRSFELPSPGQAPML